MLPTTKIDANFTEEGEQTFVHAELRDGVWKMHGVPRQPNTILRDVLAIAGFLVFLAWLIYLQCNSKSCKFTGL